MKNRLEKTNFKYLTILHIIWQLVSYYGKLFQTIAGNDPATTPAKIREENGITYITFSFPKVLNSQRNYTVLEMREIYNEYLRLILCPQQNILLPFQRGSEIHNIMEPLYVDMVYEDETTIYLDVIYIDNPIAYDYVRNDEKIKF